MGSEKAMEKATLEPYSDAKRQGEVFKYTEDFEKIYLLIEKPREEIQMEETKELDFRINPPVNR